MRTENWRERLENYFEVPAMVAMSGGGQGNGDPRWRSVAVGEKFRVVGKPTKSCSRNAAYYLKHYNLRFTCKKDGRDVIVERIG